MCPVPLRVCGYLTVTPTVSDGYLTVMVSGYLTVMVSLIM